MPPPPVLTVVGRTSAHNGPLAFLVPLTPAVVDGLRRVVDLCPDRLQPVPAAWGVTFGQVHPGSLKDQTRAEWAAVVPAPVVTPWIPLELFAGTSAHGRGYVWLAARLDDGPVRRPESQWAYSPDLSMSDLDAAARGECLFRVAVDL